MPTYKSPGVYVEDVPPSVRPIAGVGTSTAGFIGVVPNDIVMPDKPAPKADGTFDRYTVFMAGKPLLVTSWNEFTINFGEIKGANAILAHAVFGFFSNGGTRCWVIRVAAQADLESLTDELNAFAAIDEIAIVAVPGATSAAQHDALLTHCKTLGDRVAVLDGVQTPKANANDTALSFTPAAISPSARSAAGSFGAIYFPWIEVQWTEVENQVTTTRRRFVPPSGHIAGIYARSDATRGVFKTPANEVVLGALSLEHRIGRSIQDGLNPDGINVIREFNGAIKVWGGRTRADSNSNEFQYVGVRRYMNYLRESIDEGTQWVVFEPNTPSLWKRIERTITGFLTNEWRSGALFGESAQRAFFVRCNADTNPPDVRDLGRVVTEIGVATVKPAEFVIFRIEQIAGG
ncbi:MULTISPECIES: phage tail sheath C-terminal domain-containing protein [unclassified Cyanobium]|uniref:phage tail sheath family protein n=1 Tax=unclassified Cyanobium TaxID=2627006 RepID=UPI0020CF823A|nr:MULTISPECIES: phage tail sheath C-terminal domain-containing protein [unclassified Cyanobium]MCP9835692.1 phage tail sheath family protein [Cyanobium sp. La Preciosa 7G6]MCP9938483.1 phage tail sheath family protein [Cyanobium sp. Aljojuca 7A6]